MSSKLDQFNSEKDDKPVAPGNYSHQNAGFLVSLCINQALGKYILPASAVAHVFGINVGEQEITLPRTKEVEEELTRLVKALKKSGMKGEWKKPHGYIYISTFYGAEAG